jgi:nicotinate-nucleotide adenylyltransferase
MSLRSDLGKSPYESVTSEMNSVVAQDTSPSDNNSLKPLKHVREMSGLSDGQDSRSAGTLAPQARRGSGGRRRRIGIMGGTFDPIHNGHLVAASEVAWVYDLDEVIFVPTGRPAFKLNKNVTNAEDRYLMTVIATASNPRFTVSRVDIDRPGVTYTIDTLRDIHDANPEAELFFITGADAVAEILKWKEARKMFELAHFVAVTRPGYRSPEHMRSQVRVDTLEIPALAISSTDVRHRASRFEPVWYLVPDGVVQYIAKHGLYSTK